MSGDKFSRLPFLAKPFLYNIHLKPCLETFKFQGETSIVLDVVEETNCLKLHAKELDISNISCELNNGKILNDLEFELDKKWTLLTVKFPFLINPQKNVKFFFKFIGELNTKMQGFSRSVYTDADNNKKYMASTQFESTYARCAFPCFDEPIYKAIFNVTLEVNDNLTALSNMNVIEEKKTQNGKKLLKFASTPIMSTYLVAFAVGELEYIQTKSKGGIDIRVYTLPGKKEDGQFALDLAAKCFDWYAEFFGIPCPLPKCDLIAIPDFCMGAMENWGLITYREICLLVNAAKSSTLQKSQVSLIVAHEIAHFWFGNLVTMEWWTDLWLKEGFASFMEFYSVSEISPELNIWLLFIKDEVASGFALDSLHNSHPIEVEIDNPNELDEIYDNITYSKSCCVIRMLFNYLGAEIFRNGLRLYLKKFQYRNAKTIDLWNALSEASGQNINSLMSSWTKQMGYPVVYIKEKVEKTQRILKLEQSRFFADGAQDNSKSIWQIPISVVTAKNPCNPIKKFVLTKISDEIILDGVSEKDWLKINSNIASFFRVQYSSEMLELLLKAIKSKELSVIDRFSIASDLFALVGATKVPITQFLQYFAASNNEDQFIVWSAIDQGISKISSVLCYHDDNSLNLHFSKFVCEVLEPLANSLGWEPKNGEDSQTGLLRALILGRLSKFGHTKTIEIALEKFYDHYENNTEIVPDLRAVIYGVAGRTNSEKAINILQKLFETTCFKEVEIQCVSALGQVTDLKLLGSIYDYGIKDGKIRPQDYCTLFVSSSLSKDGQTFIYDYFKKNCKNLVKTLGSVNSAMFQNVMKYSTQFQCSTFTANEFKAYCNTIFDKHELQILDRPIRQITEKICLNEQLLLKNANLVKNFLSSHN